MRVKPTAKRRANSDQRLEVRCLLDMVNTLLAHQDIVAQINGDVEASVINIITDYGIEDLLVAA